MALRVGTNSYVTEQEASAYFADHGNTGWADYASKSAALINATSFIDSLCRGKWKGVKTSPEQPLAWPRTKAVDEEGYLFDSHEIPSILKAAVFETALRLSQGDELEPDEDKNVASESVAGAVSMSYFKDKSRIPALTKINRLLSGLLSKDINGDGAKIGRISKRYKNYGLV